MATKLTKMDKFALVLAQLTDEDLKDFIKHEMALLEKKAATPRKLTAEQVKSLEIRDEIAALLQSAESPLTIKEIKASVPSLVEIDASPQKIGRLLFDLGDKVVKTIVKKVAYYSWAVE